MSEMVSWFCTGFGLTLGILGAVLLVLVVAGVANELSRAIQLVRLRRSMRRSRGTGQ